MAIELGSAYISVGLGTQKLAGEVRKAFSGAEGAGDSGGRSIGGRFASGFKAMVGPALAAAASVGLTRLASSSVDAFSELEDSTAAAGVVFGKNMSQIIAQSKTAGAQLGISGQQVISAANTFGTYGKAAGLSGKELATFATENTKLAADMASFKGTSPEQAIEAIGAALRGETEPIRAYGVMLDDASLRNEALKQGLISTTKDALTPQQKTLAAQALIFAQTSDAQGDFARTSTSTANVAKTLSAESANLSAKVGGLLAPAFTAAKLKALDGVRGISAFLDKVSAAQTVMGKGGTTSNIVRALGLDPESGFGNAVQQSIGSVMALVGAFKAGGTEITSSGFAGVMERIGLMARTVWDTLKTAFAGLGPMFGQLAGQVGGLMPLLSPFGLIFQVLAPVLPQIAAMIGQLAGMLGPLLGSALAQVVPLIQMLVQHLSGVMVAIMPAVTAMVLTLGNALGQIIPVVMGVLGALMPLIGTLMSQLAPIIMDLVTSVLPPIVSIFGNIVSAIAPLITQIAGLLMPIIQALMPVVVTVFGVIANVVKSAMKIVQGIIQVVTGIIKGDWSQVWTGIQNVFKGIWDTVGSILRGAWAIIQSVIGAGLSYVSGLVGRGLEAVGRFFADTWNNVTTGISGFIDGVGRFFSDLPGNILRALGDFGSMLVDVGQNIVQGLIDGASGMIDNAVQAIKDVGGAMLGGIQDFLGIKSPSRAFMEIGRHLSEGLAVGVGKGSSVAVKAVRGMAADVQSAAEGAMPGFGVDRAQAALNRRVGSMVLAPTVGDFTGSVSTGGTSGATVVQVQNMFGTAKQIVDEIDVRKRRANALVGIRG